MLSRRLADQFRLGRKALLQPIAAGLALFIFGLAIASRVHAQSSAPDWQTAAGGKMAFDVASVKRSTPGPVEGYRSNFLTLGSSNFSSGWQFDVGGCTIYKPLLDFALSWRARRIF